MDSAAPCAGRDEMIYIRIGRDPDDEYEGSDCELPLGTMLNRVDFSSLGPTPEPRHLAVAIAYAGKSARRT